MSDKAKQAWMPLLLALTLVFGVLLGRKLNQSNASSDYIPQGGTTTVLGLGEVEEVLRYIDARYVDEVDQKHLKQVAINGILKELDPHSNYIPSESLTEVNEHLEGKFSGIGIEFFLLEDTILILSPLADGPSDQVGIIGGDKIITVEDSLVAGQGISLRDVAGLLRGEQGSEVRVGILRQGEEELKQFTITRDEIPLNSVDVGLMVNDTTGYIRVNRFSASTYEEFMKELEVLIEKEGMQNLILDLRQNPGGYLREATEMLSQFFAETGELLVYTESEKGGKKEYNSTGRAFFQIKDIVVLIDEGSASASEIIAGAIQDKDRGVIIGRRSFGKGLVQEQYELSDGAALRLTISKYYTPSGRLIQKPYANDEAYHNDFVNRLEGGELSKEDKIEQSDSTQYYTDRGDVVFGGGGITPDVFIPIDTSFLIDSYIELRQHLPRYVFRMLEQKGELKSMDKEAFFAEYQISDVDFDKFLAFSKDAGAKVELSELPLIKKELKTMLKARIAKQLYGNKGFYTVLNQDDSMIRTALEVLDSKDPVAKARNNE